MHVNCLLELVEITGVDDGFDLEFVILGANKRLVTCFIGGSASFVSSKRPEPFFRSL